MKFQKGNTASKGKGRPSRDIERKYHEWLKEAITEDDWKEIAARLVEQSKDGSVWATKILFEYLIGAPGQAIKIDQTVNSTSDNKTEIVFKWDDSNDGSGHSSE